jgi:hypothetical protein
MLHKQPTIALDERHDIPAGLQFNYEGRGPGSACMSGDDGVVIIGRSLFRTSDEKRLLWNRTRHVVQPVGDLKVPGLTRVGP